MIKRLAEILRHWGALMGLMLSAFLLAGCHLGESEPMDTFSPIPGENPAVATASNGGATSSGPAVSVGPGASKETRTNSADSLRVGAILTFIFTDMPSPPPPFDVTIREDGTITLPLNLTFTAAGKTVGYLANEVRARYVPKYYL